MRRLLWLVGGGAVVALCMVLRGPHQEMIAPITEAATESAATPDLPPAAQPAQQAGTGQAGAGPEKTVFTFENDAKMEEFTKLWQRRQGVVLRMTVLQAYWNEEQAALADLNSQIAAAYKLDVTKNYYLDSERRVLVEREAPPAPPDSASVAQAGQPPPVQRP